jgi:hypothetical protein
MLKHVEHDAWKLAGTLMSAAQVLPEGDPDRLLLEALSGALSRAGAASEQQSLAQVEQPND